MAHLQEPAHGRGASGVAANVLNYNHGRYLPACLESLAGQTLAPRVTLIDNASPEGLPESVVRRPDVHLLQTGRNLGYAAGHNRGIRESCEPYVLVLNPDLRLEPGCVAALVAALEAEPRAGMAGGKLLRMGGGAIPETGRAGPPSIIDSTGVQLTRTRKSFDRGADEVDRGQYDQAVPPFGPSGAAALFRRAMLEDIALDGEYFDEDFFMYREEVDLAWRARLRGWECAYAPAAVGYHVRAYAPGTRRYQPELHRLLQFRNRYWMIFKNDHPLNVLRSLPWLLGYEALALGHTLLREPFLAAGYIQAIRLLPRMLAKRRRIQSRRRVSAGAMRQWFR